jgi:hypothetical protein
MTSRTWRLVAASSYEIRAAIFRLRADLLTGVTHLQ